MYITDIDFKQEFLSISFDNILIEHNNPLINSYEHYIIYKQQYIRSSKQNMDSYIQLYTELQTILEQQNIKTSDSRFSFVFTEPNHILNLKTQLKNILIQQRKLLSNFMHYLQILNSDYEKLLPKPVSKSKSLNVSTKPVVSFTHIKRNSSGGTRTRKKVISR
jgi:hypothetical protein